jgi:hypothetical protein
MCIQAKPCGRMKVFAMNILMSKYSTLNNLQVKMSDQLNKDIKELLHI